MDLFIQLLVNGIANGSQYALLGIGFALIFGTTGIAHFAYGPLFAASAYIIWWLVMMGIPFVPAILIAVAASALLGMASYVLVYQPLVERDSSAFVILVSSLGLFIIITNLISIIFGTDAKTLNNVGYGIYFIGDAVVSGIQIAQVILLGAVALLLQLFLKHTGWGQAIRAVTNNPEMARVVGIDTRKVVLMVFAAGSGIACLASACLLLRDGASTHVGFLSVFYAFIAVVVGGVGSIWGAVIGGLALGLLESIGMWKLPSEWQSTIAFLVLFVVILWRPTGLLKGQ